MFIASAVLLGCLEYRALSAPLPNPIVKTFSIPADAVEVKAEDLCGKTWNTVTDEDWDLIYRSHDFVGSPKVVVAMSADEKPKYQELVISLLLERKSETYSVRREIVHSLFPESPAPWHAKIERIDRNTFRFYPIRDWGVLALGMAGCLALVAAVFMALIKDWSKLKAAWCGVDLR